MQKPHAVLFVVLSFSIRNALAGKAWHFTDVHLVRAVHPDQYTLITILTYQNAQDPLYVTVTALVS